MSDYPFGDPDGSRAELADVMQGFVAFSGHPGWGGITTNADDRSVRVIVGKKGSGKTLYLRRLQTSTLSDESLFSQKIQSDIPTTSQVLEFCEICQGDLVTEKWRELWRVAIFSSLLSLFIHKDYFSPYVSRKKRDDLKKRFSSLLPNSEATHSAYDVISYYISIIRTQSQYTNFMNQPLWVDLRHTLSEIMKEAPPVFYYLDAVDEEFSHAPMEWHQCQKGLFYAVMRILREQGALGNRLHVTICIRDIVFSSVLRSEHAGRYRNAPHICKLNWDTTRISHFFEKKIEQLGNEYFDKADGPKNLSNFLSIDVIRNEDRGIYESLLPYIVRHTRFLPRDIVEVGNALARAKLAVKNGMNLDKPSWQSLIREIVSRCARGFAEEQLTICANQLASHDRPSFSAHHKYHELYTAGNEYIAARAELFKTVIRFVGSELFSPGKMQEARAKFSGELPKNVDIFSILWQNGLLGCAFGENERGFSFFNLDDRDDFILPNDAKLFAFHSCINDSIKIENNSSTPIVERTLI